MTASKNGNKFGFMGFKFNNTDMSTSLEEIDRFITARTPRMIFTPTAELIVMAHENPQIKRIYDRTALLTLDSYVVYYAAKLCGKPVKEPVSAVRLMFNLLPVAQERGYRLFLLGAHDEIVHKTVRTIKDQYPSIKIVGYHDGYFDFEEEQEIVREIRESKADILFVAMSSPLKERFISVNLDKLGVPVCMGVGGSFDIIAGKCQLAPSWISRIGLEWFYRLAQEPRRLWKRYLITNTKFLKLWTREFYRSILLNGARSVQEALSG